MSQDNRAVNTVLSDEENAAVALSVARWNWKDAPVALFISIVLSIWRPSWGETYEEVIPFEGDADDTDDAISEIAVLFRGGGKEFVNERFKALIAKCVPSPITSKKPDASYDEKGKPVLKRQPPRNRKGEPLIDTKGRLVVAIRDKDAKGKGSPDPKKFLAWVMTHEGKEKGYWVSARWLKHHGLMHVYTWWGDVFDEESGKDKTRKKTVREILFHPCLLTQEELTELRAIMLVSTIAAEEGMIKAAALTVRKDGSVEFGIGGFGPTSSDKRDLYQEIHDKDSDDTRTKLKAIIERERTDTLPWMAADYDGPTSRQRDLDMFALGLNPGYEGVKPLPKPDMKANKEKDRLSYRIGSDLDFVGRVNGKRRILREKVVLINPDTGEPWTPQDDEGNDKTRTRCVRHLDRFTRDNGSKGACIRYGEAIPAKYVTARYPKTGVRKRIDRSLREEIDGMIRGLIEAGQFEFTLRRRPKTDDPVNWVKVTEYKGKPLEEPYYYRDTTHKCYGKSCPHDVHAFKDMGYADVCQVSGKDYWMVKALIELDPAFFPFLDIPEEVECLVVDVYGELVGDLMRIAPDAFKEKTSGVEVMGHPSLNALLI